MPDRETVKRLIGTYVSVLRGSGICTTGVLLNVSRHSLWLVEGDEDRFVRIADVRALSAAPTIHPPVGSLG